MKSWGERSREEAYLLNPAFCSIIIVSACIGYRESNRQPLPFALVFMILPLILHKHTRESLPKKSNTSLPGWLQENCGAKLGFYDRLKALQPHTREALNYGLIFNLIGIDNSGSINSLINNNQVRKAFQVLDREDWECVAKAKILGKWFGNSASTETTMALWGIRP